MSVKRILAALSAALVLGLIAAAPSSAADLGPVTAGPGADEQTVPQEQSNPPGQEAGEFDDGAGQLGEGEAAVADGGSATPWVAIGIVALVLAAIGAIIWTSRSRGDINPDELAALERQRERQYYPDA